MTEKKKNIPYLASTAIFALAILPGAIVDIVQPDMLQEFVELLQIPAHLLLLIGFWKILGVMAVVLPIFRPNALPKVTEWAYAGFFFDLTGAAFLHGAVGDYASIAPPLVLLGVMFVSYRTREVAA